MVKMKLREEVQEKDKWQLNDLYGSLEAWNSDYQKVEQLLEKMIKQNGKQDRTPLELANLLSDYSEINSRFERLYVYANQRLHEDMGNDASQVLAGKAQNLHTKLLSGLSFLEPELLAMDEELWTRILKDQQFIPYKRYLTELRRQKEHQLDEKMEEVLAKATELEQSPSTIFSMFNNADIKFQPVVDKNGVELPLTQGRYIFYMQSEDRQLREQAFDNLYLAYEQHINMLAATYHANVKGKVFFAKERNYGSTREYALDKGNIPVSVYDNLIDVVHENLEPMYRYLKLRKIQLQVSHLHMYDIYVPFVEQQKEVFSFEQAKKNSPGRTDSFGRRLFKPVKGRI